jgi:hypothetical protein
LAIFEGEKVDTKITYGPLNEKRVSCKVRIDTNMAKFESEGGSAKFEKTMAKALKVDQKYV